MPDTQDTQASSDETVSRVKNDISKLTEEFSKALSSFTGRAGARSSVFGYRQAERILDEAYAQLTVLDKLRLTDAFTLAAQASVAVGFGAWWYLLPTTNVAFGIVSTAHAATVGATNLDAKTVINIAIFVGLFFTFLLTLGVHYFSKSRRAAENAGTVFKTLLGFFIGASTKYLGITS
jgi:hypothetical protein